MPKPIWMSIILIFYSCLSVFILLLSIIIRLFKISPRKPRLVASIKSLIKLKKIFGCAALGLLALSLILPPFIINAEQRTGGEISNFMAFIFFLEWISTIYTAALWFLASSLNKNLE